MSIKILDVVDGDVEYDRAFDIARKSFDRLHRLWFGPYDGKRTFMIKVCFQGIRRPIFLWLELVAINDDSYTAVAFETTDELPAISEGQQVTVPRNLALDWLVNDHGTVHGAFTLLVERRRLTGTALAEFDDLLMAKSWVDA